MGGVQITMLRRMLVKATRSSPAQCLSRVYATQKWRDTDANMFNTQRHRSFATPCIKLVPACYYYYATITRHSASKFMYVNFI